MKSNSYKKETNLKAAIKAKLEANGWFVQYIIPQRGNKHGKGVPDVVAMKDGEVFWIECKQPGNRQSPEQLEFMAQCDKHNIGYVLAYYLDDIAPLCQRKSKKG